MGGEGEGEGGGVVLWVAKCLYAEGYAGRLPAQVDFGRRGGGTDAFDVGVDVAAGRAVDVYADGPAEEEEVEVERRGREAERGEGDWQGERGVAAEVA